MFSGGELCFARMISFLKVRATFLECIFLTARLELFISIASATESADENTSNRVDLLHFYLFSEKLC